MKFVESIVFDTRKSDLTRSQNWKKSFWGFPIGKID